MDNNTDHMLKTSQLYMKLEKYGKYLSEGRDAIDNLRNMQQFLSSWDYNHHRDSKIEFLVFFLRSFIGKVFYNLIRDITFSEGFQEKDQIQFCKTVGETFYNLGVRLQEQKFDEFYPYCVQLAIAYLDTVEAINTRVSGSETQSIE